MFCSRSTLTPSPQGTMNYNISRDSPYLDPGAIMDLVTNLSIATVANGSNTTGGSFHLNDPFRFWTKLILTRIVVGICVFGVIGNILNILVLTRNSLRKSMHCLERSSHTGLLALSVSDLIFCTLLLPQAVNTKQGFIYSHIGFMMIYEIYSPGIINTFIMISTWLTVTLATQRYLAICYPIKTRLLIVNNSTYFSIIGVVLVSAIVNIPRYFFDKIYTVSCPNGDKKHFIYEGFIKQNKKIMTSYLSFCFIFGLILPLVLLSYCNVKLVKALKKSTKLRRIYSNEIYNKSREVETTHRITLTLIVIVVMFTILVIPAEVANFVRDIIKVESQSKLEAMNSVYHFNFTIAILNSAQCLNFAFNFILYCCINTHFRKTLRVVLTCKFWTRTLMAREHDDTRLRLNSLSTRNTILDSTRSAGDRHINK